MKTTHIVTGILLFFSMSLFAQLKIDAELRPRFEYRHGFKTLFPDNADPAAFVSQRTRLNAAYKTEKLNFYLSVQDVRVWGDVPQLNTADNLGSSVHQAWAALQLNQHLALKVGRQEINLDDQRIFGSVNWVQQARSHDAALLKYIKNGFKMDLGFAFNQSQEALTGTTLNTPGTYKAMQYIWLHKNWENVSGSLLFLNNGLQFIDAADANNNETRYSQTLGSHLKFSLGELNLISNLFYQFGNDVNNHSLSAYLLSLEGNYRVSDGLLTGIGAELISGNDNGTVVDGDNKAFTPLYGTNHKFNGLMDYFYVGNHANNVGLLDLYVKAHVKMGAKSKLNMALHSFSAAAEMAQTDDKYLGAEWDMVFTHKLSKNVNLAAGYSHLFPSEGMELLKNNTDGNSNNWGWVMLVIKPTLFTQNN